VSYILAGIQTNFVTGIPAEFVLYCGNGRSMGHENECTSAADIKITTAQRNTLVIRNIFFSHDATGNL
jgi:hypothetical protein